MKAPEIIEACLVGLDDPCPRSQVIIALGKAAVLGHEEGMRSAGSILRNVAEKYPQLSKTWHALLVIAGCLERE